MVSVEEVLYGSEVLVNLIQKYKENGYNIVEQKRERSPTIIKKPKENKTS